MNSSEELPPSPASSPPRRLRIPYSDVAMGAGVVIVMAMLILPLSPAIIDVLVGVNIAIGVVLLMMALYIRSPLEFSVFPNVLLLSTLFRLSLSIATTRQILLHGHAGKIIQTFGTMVAGGNLVVGMVVFLIITVVQFIVVAKGAERVAEVRARFTLDAMPGKQLSIEADLRSGLLDQAEARRKRSELALESDLHGGLDGAMKFVKGDAVAGLLIVAVNLLAGLAIGVMQQGLDVSTAVTKYSVLTIGEGMIAQIPALMSVMAAGLVVTCAEGEHGARHLGESIARQVASKPNVLMMSAGLCLLLALIPGFPWMVFLLLAFGLGAVGARGVPAFREPWDRWFGRAKLRYLRPEPAQPTEVATGAPQAQGPLPLQLEVPASFLLGDGSALLVRALERRLDAINLHLGLPLPRIAVQPVEGDGAQTWCLQAYELPIARGALQAGGTEPLAEEVHQALLRHCPRFLGAQEANAILMRASQSLPDVVKELLRVMTLHRVAEVLRRLVEEGVSIRNTREVLESMSEAAQREKDLFTLTELTRTGLKLQISHQVAPDGVLRAVTLQPALEELLRKSVRVVQGTPHLALDPARAHALTIALGETIRAHRPAALLTGADIRRHVRKLIEVSHFDTPVIGFNELVRTLSVQVDACVGLPLEQLTES
jgi:type III secretion protein V